MLQSTAGSAGKGRVVWLTANCRDANSMAIKTDMFVENLKSAGVYAVIAAHLDQVGESVLPARWTNLT